MKKLLLAALVAVHCSLHAITIPLPLPSPPALVTEHIISFADLVGEELAGQTFILDFPCPSGTFIRLYPVSPTFNALLALQTDFSGLPGFISGLGSVLDPVGAPILTEPLGAASSSSGLLAAGLVLPALPVTPALDLYGFRYELSLPITPGAYVTSAELRLLARGPIGIGPGVPDEWPAPEGGDAAFMLCVGCFVILAGRRVFQ